MGGVSDGAHARSEALRGDVGDGLRAHVQHQRVDEGDVVPHARLTRHLHTDTGENITTSHLSSNLKATRSVRGFLFLLQNHVIRYKLYLL